MDEAISPFVSETGKKLLILPAFEARTYLPKEPTYALRIFSTRAWNDRTKSHVPLVDSSYWVHIAEYCFDDNVPGAKREAGPQWIDKPLAKNIIDDFAEHDEEAKTLMVHCALGNHRGPAVALALNDRFKIGFDRDRIIDKHPHYRRHLYDFLMSV